MSAQTTRVSIRTNSEEQTIALGMHLAGLVRAGDVVAIEGELGAGKTRFVRGIAMGFRVPMDEVRSPTFALAHEYTVQPGRPRLVHIDAFRLGSPDELDSIGWDRLHTPDAVVVIEWADRLADRVPPESYRVRIDHAGVETRQITIDCPPPNPRAGASLKSFGIALQGSAPAVHRCRSCGREIDTSVETFPFCSMRCKQADLGNWFSERYRISRDVTERDLDEG